MFASPHALQAVAQASPQVAQYVSLLLYVRTVALIRLYHLSSPDSLRFACFPLLRRLCTIVPLPRVHHTFPSTSVPVSRPLCRRQFLEHLRMFDHSAFS